MSENPSRLRRSQNRNTSSETPRLKPTDLFVSSSNDELALGVDYERGPWSCHDIAVSLTAISVFRTMSNAPEASRVVPLECPVTGLPAMGETHNTHSDWCNQLLVSYQTRAVHGDHVSEILVVGR